MTTADGNGVPHGDEPPAEPATPPEVPRPLRTVVRVLLTAYLLSLAWLSLRPLPVSWTYPANLTPLASVHQAFALGGLSGLRQLAAAILPLAPFGVLLPLAGGRLRAAWLPSFLRSAGGAALLATALEILESWAPGHVSNVDDILLGTLGAAVCHLAVVPAVRALLLRERPTPAEAAEPLRRTYGLAAPGRTLHGLSASGTSTRR